MIWRCVQEWIQLKTNWKEEEKIWDFHEPDPPEKEVEEAANRMKYGEAPERDNISPEIIAYMEEEEEEEEGIRNLPTCVNNILENIKIADCAMKDDKKNVVIIGRQH